MSHDLYQSQSRPPTSTMKTFRSRVLASTGYFPGYSYSPLTSPICVIFPPALQHTGCGSGSQAYSDRKLQPPSLFPAPLPPPARNQQARSAHSTSRFSGLRPLFIFQVSIFPRFSSKILLMKDQGSNLCLPFT